MLNRRFDGRWEIGDSDEGYPAALRDLPDPPKRLYGYGNVDFMSSAAIAIIGARRASPYGLSCARMFAEWAASSGVVVISGAAIGCDTAAHKGARAVEGPTVAVLPCGADVDYPASNRALLAELRRNASVVSELPWGCSPTKWTFVKRNRIIAALGSALLVTEAGLPSGTFTTADFALELGRDVCAVPGSILAPECYGSNRLIRNGAIPITDVSELADVCGRPWGRIDRPPREVFSDRVLSALRTSPMRPDDLVRALTLDIVEVVRAISALEIAGRVTRYRDGRYGAVWSSNTKRGKDVQSDQEPLISQ